MDASIEEKIIMEIDDEILVKKTQAGNKEAFGELVLRYQKRIYELAYSFTHDVEDAYDLSQDIFIKALEAIGRFQGNSSFYTWLYQIARNTCIDYTRKKKRRKLITFGDIPLINRLCRENSRNQMIHRVEKKEISEQIKKAVNRLPPRQKQVFVLRHYQQLNLKEIAELLGLKIGTVKAHHFNAIRKLRKLLSHYVEE